MTDSDYAGNLSPKEAWELLSSDPKARLVDVRTMPEWTFVGVPDLKSLDKQLYFIPWQLHPNMQQNPEFADQVRSSGVEHDDPLLFICRSGGRSRMAAIASAAVPRQQITSRVARGDLTPRPSRNRT